MSVDIIIATYSSYGQKYLDDCLLSIQRQTLKDKKVYVVSSGDYKPQINTTLDVNHFHYLRRLHFPEAVNEGVKRSSSDHILICNDDIIMQKDCLANILKHSLENPTMILNPVSTCDNGKFFSLPIHFKLREFFHMFESSQYKHDQISPHYVNEIIESMAISPYPDANIGMLYVQFAAFYCTIMSRKIWNDVGGIDTALKTGQDDLDFCLRAKNIGIRSAICLDAYAFHYSGATADIHLTKDDRMFNIDHFNKKWTSKGISIPQLK